jgi:hypothetical protein
MCWGACDRLGKISRAYARHDRAALWTSRAEAIRVKIFEQT